MRVAPTSPSFRSAHLRFAATQPAGTLETAPDLFCASRIVTPTDEVKTVPRLVAACDVTKLPISSLEGFVLSRIDGAGGAREIASMTGIASEEVTRILWHLVSLGAVEWPGATPPLSLKNNATVSVAAQARPRDLPPSKYDPSELEQPGDLDPALKRRILDLFHGLEDIDYYTLLGIGRTAERKPIKSAYYALAATFHTDRYFGKNLGVFKQKMEHVFGRITLAHDTLTNKQRRAEYDEYLTERDRTQAFERLLSAVEAEPGDLEADASIQALTAPRVPVLSPSIFPTVPAVVESRPPHGMPASLPPVRLSESGAPTGPSISIPPSMSLPPGGLPPEAERLRRESLARRFAGGRGFAARTPSGNPMPRKPPPPMDTRAATESLKRRYHDGLEHGRQTQARKFIETAETALAKKDLLSAANNYRLALKYTDDPAIQQAYEDTNRQARDSMADAYLKQGKYEESQGKWREAGISYGKASEGRPDNPEVALLAAEALRREGRDLHQAARYAEAAVQKNPNNAAFRVTLGHVYLDAGLILRARSEIEQAAKLDPTDSRAKELLAQIRKMAS
ncbi:MAG: hypothetical protein NVSMB1_14030 [Polyangiales bacterium]